MLVPGAMAAMSPDSSRKNPAEAACEPEGHTNVATGTFETRIADAISRMEVERPPGVEISTTTSEARSSSADLSSFLR